MVELALDFEACLKQSKLSSPLRYRKSKGGSTSIRQRARIMKRYLDKINELCRRNRIPRIIPAEECSRVHSLRTIGGPPVFGYNKRPMFASPQTSRILEDELSRQPQASTGWGDNFFPKYQSTSARDNRKRKLDPTTGKVKK